MRTIVRFIILLALVFWIGGSLFFGAVLAPVAFGSLMPTFSNVAVGIHAAGTMVRDSLLHLHDIGLIAGIVLLVLCIVERLAHFTRRSIVPNLVLLAIMLALTAYSQYSIIPRMDSLIVQAGPAMYVPAATNPAKSDFNRLHNVATDLDGIVLLCGLALIVLYARPERSA